MPRRGEQPPVLDCRRLRGSSEGPRRRDDGPLPTVEQGGFRIQSPDRPGTRRRRHHLIRHWVAPAADLTLGENTVDVAT